MLVFYICLLYVQYYFVSDQSLISIFVFSQRNWQLILKGDEKFVVSVCFVQFIFIFMMFWYVLLGGSVSFVFSINLFMNFLINYLQCVGVFVQKVVIMIDIVIFGLNSFIDVQVRINVGESIYIICGIKGIYICISDGWIFVVWVIGKLKVFEDGWMVVLGFQGFFCEFISNGRYSVLLFKVFDFEGLVRFVFFDSLEIISEFQQYVDVVVVWEFYQSFLSVNVVLFGFLV